MGKVKQILAGGISAFAVAAIALVPTVGAAGNTNGFDEYGYNRTARVFVGTCKSWAEQKNLDVAEACGTYVNDSLVMKWNKAWDECNAAGSNDEAACADAWLNQTWNGKKPNGSGETYGAKTIWVGSKGESSPYWQDGGYLLWGNYEVVFEKTSVRGSATAFTAKVAGVSALTHN